MKKIALLLTMVMSLSLVACGAEKETAEVAVPEFSITVVTVDGEQTLDQSMVADLAVSEAEILKTSKKGDTTSTWTGFDFTDALDLVGVTEYTTITVEATDGYAQEYTADVADAAMLVYLENGELLGEDGPLNTVIEGQSGNMWMKNLAKVIVE